MSTHRRLTLEPTNDGRWIAHGRVHHPIGHAVGEGYTSIVAEADTKDEAKRAFDEMSFQRVLRFCHGK